MIIGMRRLVLVLCLGLAAAASFGAPQAATANTLRFEISKIEPTPNSFEYLEDPCGAAVDSKGDLYVSDYYHRRVDIFSPSGKYLTHILGIGTLDGPCGLAVDASGDLYVDEYHGEVLRYAPSSYPPSSSTTYSGPVAIDPAHTSHATGVAVDAAGNLYVDERSYVAEYEAPVTPASEAAKKIGQGTLGTGEGAGYGLAISEYAATAGYLYVPDAETRTVNVYDPATSTAEPIARIDGSGTLQAGFVSLADTAVAVNRVNGHLFVVDDLQSGVAERPRAVLEEFNAQGDYRAEFERTVIDGEPPGLALDNSSGATKGDIYLTSGNSEKSGVLAFGPTPPGSVLLEVSKSGAGSGTVESFPTGIRCGSACAAEFSLGAKVTLLASPSAGSELSGWSGCETEPSPAECTVTMSEARSVEAKFEPAPVAPTASTTALAPPPTAPSRRSRASASEVVQRENVLVAFEGKLAPKTLPRRGAAPISVSLGGRISTADGSAPPQLRQIAIQMNREGRFDYAGLPLCKIPRIQPSTNQGALAACRGALIGEGSFSANVLLPQQAPFPSNGKVLAFNGTYKGHHAILAHVYGTEPVPTSYTLPFLIKPSRGTYGTTLTASLPQTTGEWGFVTGLQMTLSRRWRSGGASHSYLSAGCPAPRGFPSVVFPLARTTFGFAGNKKLVATLMRECRARG